MLSNYVGNCGNTFDSHLRIDKSFDGSLVGLRLSWNLPSGCHWGYLAPSAPTKNFGDLGCPKSATKPRLGRVVRRESSCLLFGRSKCGNAQSWTTMAFRQTWRSPYHNGWPWFLNATEVAAPCCCGVFLCVSLWCVLCFCLLFGLEMSSLQLGSLISEVKFPIWVDVCFSVCIPFRILLFFLFSVPFAEGLWEMFQETWQIKNIGPWVHYQRAKSIIVRWRHRMKPYNRNSFTTGKVAGFAAAALQPWHLSQELPTGYFTESSPLDRSQGVGFSSIRHHREEIHYINTQPWLAVVIAEIFKIYNKTLPWFWLNFDVFPFITINPLVWQSLTSQRPGEAFLVLWDPLQSVLDPRWENWWRQAW